MNAQDSPAIRLNKILAPVDFSKASQQALRYASAFARQFQAELVLLHVVEFAFVGSEFGAVELAQIEADMREHAGKQLDEMAGRELAPQLKFKKLIASGRPFAEIARAASDEAVDLIIIATHGHSSLAHVLLGSTVERVVRHASCPVLVVRRQEHEFVVSA